MNLDNISPQDMMKSLSLDANRNMVFQAGEGAGKSGSFFFFSHDNRFLIKTLKGAEKKILLNMLDDYIDHIEKTNNKSLLARIYGIFTVKTNYFDPLDIIVMQNTSLLESKSNPKMIFDLKGSTVNRKEHLETKFWKNSLNFKKILKDNNYLEISQDLNLLSMKIDNKETLERILELDSKFLEVHRLMDYSLLLIIE